MLGKTFQFETVNQAEILAALIKYLSDLVPSSNTHDLIIQLVEDNTSLDVSAMKDYVLNEGGELEFIGFDDCEEEEEETFNFTPRFKFDTSFIKDFPPLKETPIFNNSWVENKDIAEFIKKRDTDLEEFRKKVSKVLEDPLYDELKRRGDCHWWYLDPTLKPKYTLFSTDFEGED